MVEPAPSPVDPLSIPPRPELTGHQRIGVLLSHGFTGSPVSIRPWAEHLAARGYGVEVPLLPGHGTSWKDLNTHRWEDWYGEVRAAFERLRAAHDVVFVGGLSMGGTLAMALAAEFGDHVAGVMVVNPALATKRIDVKFLPVLKHLLPGLPGIANDIKKPDVEEFGYSHTPLKAIHSFMQQWPRLIKALPEITAPVIYFRSVEDHVVDDSTHQLVRARIGTHDFTEVTLFDSYHVATLDNDAPRIYSDSEAFIRRHAPSVGSVDPVLSSE